MKNKILLAIALLFVFISTAKAETITYEICQSGCDYSSYDDVLDQILTLDVNKTYDIVVDIKDNGTYQVTRNFSFEHGFNPADTIKASTIVIKGTGSERPTFTTDEQYIQFNYFDYITIQNINFEADSLQMNDDLYRESKLIIKDSTMNVNEFRPNFRHIEIENLDITTNSFFSVYVSNSISIKNSKIKLLAQDENLDWNAPVRCVRFDTNKVYIENTEITANYVFSTDNTTNFEMNNSKMNVLYDFTPDSSIFKMNNSEINIGRNFNIYGIVDITNSKIKTTNNVGLRLIDADTNLKNTTISGATEYAVEFLSSDFAKGYYLNIEDSDLSNNTHSLHLDTATTKMYYIEEEADYYTDQYQPERVHEKYGYRINGTIKNSKIKDIVTEDKKGLGAGNVYVTKSAKWSSKPTRAQTLTAGNIVELNHGVVILEKDNSAVLNLRDKNINIYKYFEELTGQVLGEWTVVDPTILKIVDGKIIPLKAGNTEIYTVVNGTSYVLSVYITEDQLNPNTKTFISYIVIFVLAVSGMIFFIVNEKKKQYK